MMERFQQKDVGCPQYIDGITPTRVPRQPVNDEFVSENFYSWNAEANGFKYDAVQKRVCVPFSKAAGQGSKFTQGTFVRVMNQCNYKEFGVVKSAWGPNPNNIFSPEVNMGAGEKVRIMRRSQLDPNRVNTCPQTLTNGNGKARNNALAQGVSKIDKMHLLGLPRRYLMVTYMFLSGIATMEALSSVDADHVKNLKKFALDNDKIGSVPASIQEKIKAIKQITNDYTAELEGEGADGTSPAWDENPLLSDFNCFHLEKTDASDLDSLSCQWVDVDKPYVHYRGHTTSEPFEEMGIMTGIAVWSYDDTSKRVEVFTGYSTHGHFPDPEVAAKRKNTAVFWAGNVDGTGPGPTKEMRPAYAGFSQDQRAPGAVIWRIIEALPKDPFFLYAPFDELCPKRFYEKLGADLEKADLNGWQSKMMKLTSKGTCQKDCTHEVRFALENPDKLQDTGDKMSLIVRATQCSSGMLKTFARNRYSEFDILDSSSYVHAMLEPPAGLVRDFLVDSWNHLDRKFV